MSRVQEGAERKPDQAQDVAWPEALTASVVAFELDFAPFDYHERVAPLGLVELERSPGPDRDRPQPERRREKPSEQGTPAEAVDPAHVAAPSFLIDY